MSIRLGFNSIFDQSIYRAIDFAAKHKFSAIELWVSVPQFFPEKYSNKDRIKIANYSQFKNIQIQIHGPEDLSLFSYYPEVRIATINYFKRLMDFAKDIGARTLTVHPGKITTFTFPKKSGLALFDFYPKYFLPIFRQNLVSLGKYAKGKVMLCLENTDHFEPPIKKIITPLLNKQQLFLTWDVAKTYNKNGTLNSQDERFLLKHLPSVKNVHLHDINKRPGHSHGIIGQGFVDFSYFLHKLKKLDVNCILEVRPHANVLLSRKNFLNILK